MKSIMKMPIHFHKRRRKPDCEHAGKGKGKENVAYSSPRSKSDGRYAATPSLTSGRGAHRESVPFSTTKRAEGGASQASFPDLACASPLTVPASVLDAFDFNQVLLQSWTFAYNGSRPLQLTGQLFNTKGGSEEGDFLEFTSQVSSLFTEGSYACDVIPIVSASS